MKIILHNPSHNGDQLHTLGIVKHIIEDNPDKYITIIPACAMYLFNELLSDKVNLEVHPVLWDNNRNIYNNDNFISNNHNVLWNYHESDIYINMWKLLVHQNYNCISLVDRITFIKNLFNEIYVNTGVIINFTCNNYKNLIPILPYVDISTIREKILSYKKKVVFFYNQNSCCGIEGEYSNDINESTIKNLIKKYSDDYIIILSKPSTINNKNLINVESEFNVTPSIDAKNLIINSYIANMCDEVYFKTNGGSLFILNQMNISNKDVKYNFIGNQNWYNIYKNEYELNVFM